LPVIATEPGWLDVREAQRPNQSTAWIPASYATLSGTPYFLVLDLHTAQIKVFLHGEPLASFPVGIGTTTDPTVTGDYFVAMKVPPPDPGYGPFVLATSAHSDSITDWGDSGDAVVGIHGPITSFDDQLIGTTGARISHGCIRLHDGDLAQLAGVPAGTPLDIVN
jgi:lipoprotein-anchoring transpeptidase ErfK/SrfK